MHGGEIVVLPEADAGFVAAESSIVGNACLYGATGGDFHANGRAGERFCVRNSGAYAVCEGTGDHCCEYMTGGLVVVLGTVGRNVGAGMTGGIGYFYDEDGRFKERVNCEIVKVQRVSTFAGEVQLKNIVERHFEKTGSERAEAILDNWKEEVGKFWQVFPPSESTSSVVTETILGDVVRVSAIAPSEEPQSARPRRKNIQFHQSWLAYDEEYETGSTRRKTRELCWVDKRTLPWKLIPGSALEPCARDQNRPLWVCDRMAKEIVVVDDMGTSFTNRERGKLIEFVEKLSRSIGACERIHQTSVPLNYARHALRSLTVWLWTLPAVLVKDLGLLTGPVVAVLSWILFGVYEIGSRIEDPFQGTLRLSVYCDAIRRDVLADAIQRDTAFILEGEEGKSLVDVEGEEDAVFELESESEEYDGDDVLPIKKKKTQKPQKSWFPGL